MARQSTAAHTAEPKLTPAQRDALEAAVKYGRANYWVSGRSAHGGYSATRTVLIRNGWINPYNETITDAGRAAIAAAKGGAS